MIRKEPNNVARLRRHARVRKEISGTKECPRLDVFRSNKAIYAQVIDDVNKTTLASSSSVALKIKNGGNVEAAKAVVFDRGGYQYHGRVAALADAAREAGLEF